MKFFDRFDYAAFNEDLEKFAEEHKDTIRLNYSKRRISRAELETINPAHLGMMIAVAVRDVQANGGKMHSINTLVDRADGAEYIVFQAVGIKKK